MATTSQSLKQIGFRSEPEWRRPDLGSTLWLVAALAVLICAANPEGFRGT